jgi:hypothetical protein
MGSWRQEEKEQEHKRFDDDDYQGHKQELEQERALTSDSSSDHCDTDCLC